MTECEYISDCDTSEEYRVNIANEQNSAIRKILQKEYRDKCQRNHRNCQTRKCLRIKNEREKINKELNIV